MKRFLQFIISVLVVGMPCLILSHWSKSKEQVHTNQKIYVYNWGEYIDPELIKELGKETGIQVVYETFSSNEAMEAEIRNGGTHYDVAFPSEYTVQRLKRNHLLLPIDHNKVPSIKNSDSDYINMSLGRGNKYSLPYFFGAVGILYNKEKYPNESFDSWKSLYNPKLKNQILLVDGAREIIGMSLNKLGYNLNDRNSHHLEKAERGLTKLTPQTRGVVDDEITMMLQQNEDNIAVVWSGVAAPLAQEEDKYNYVIPKEGSNLWFGNMIIPKTAQNKEDVYKFMDLLLDAKNNKQNTKLVDCATPNKAARQLLPKEIKDDHRFYPIKKEQERLEVYKDLGPEVLSEYNENFLNFKMSLK